MHFAVYGKWTTKLATCTQTFPLIKLGGWKHSIAFHKASETIDATQSNTLDNTDVMERSVIGKWGGRRSFRDWGDIGLCAAAGKLPRLTSHRNVHSDGGPEHQQFSEEKGYPMGQCHHKGPSLTGDARRLSTWRQRWYELETDGKWPD